jgi:hypothetical protein
MSINILVFSFAENLIADMMKLWTTLSYFPVRDSSRRLAIRDRKRFKRFFKYRFPILVFNTLNYITRLIPVVNRNLFLY